MTVPGGLQFIQNAPAAIGGALSGPRRPGGRLGSPARYGLTMWFKVVVDHVGTSSQSLGLWSSCSGLGVTFKPDEFREGGDYNGPLYLPGEISYGQITLERAMDREGSDKVRSWLTQVAAKWINADEAGASPRKGPTIGAHRVFQGTPVVVTLYSNLKQAAGEEIATWELQNAIPVAWSGPTLSAKGSEVAVEKLTLVHRGFLKPEGGPATAGGKTQAAQPDQGKLKISHKNDVLEFQYNPVKVGLDKTVSIERANVLATTVDQQVTDPGKLSIKLNDLRVEGVTAVHDKIKKLFDWLAPYPPEPAAAKAPAAAPAAANPGAKTGAGGDKAKGNTARPKQLLVQMGAGPGPGRIERTAILKVVSVSYTRFTTKSVPNRASVTLTLEEVENPTPGQNPTSGGPPGGRVHTVTAGDNLQRIATGAYGSPSAWRQVAEANGIDDPLRVRNGRPVYLPAR